MTRTPDEWAEVTRAELAGVVGAPTLVGTLQVDVTGGADGDVAVHIVFDAGAVVGAGPGPAEDPDATLTLTAADAQAVVAGDLDPSVAFMQGRMKVAGDMGLVLDALALAAGDGARSARDRVAAFVSS